MPPLAEVQAATENLIHVCQKNDVAVTGFIWGSNQNVLFMHFGNIKQTGLDLLDIHWQLCLTVLEKEMKNLVKEYKLEPRDESKPKPDGGG